MKKLLPIALIFSLNFLSSSAKSDQESIQQLTEELNYNLIQAEPILGRKVVENTFNSTPLLITFFASW